MGMNENVDILVCHPDVGINKTFEAVFIQFEVMNPDTQEGTGKSHTVMMTIPDAMRPPGAHPTEVLFTEPDNRNCHDRDTSIEKEKLIVSSTSHTP
jgi:hypothetical protein